MFAIPRTVVGKKYWITVSYKVSIELFDILRIITLKWLFILEYILIKNYVFKKSSQKNAVNAIDFCNTFWMPSLIIRYGEIMNKDAVYAFVFVILFECPLSGMG